MLLHFVCSAKKWGIVFANNICLFGLGFRPEHPRVKAIFDPPFRLDCFSFRKRKSAIFLFFAQKLLEIRDSCRKQEKKEDKFNPRNGREKILAIIYQLLCQFIIEEIINIKWTKSYSHFAENILNDSVLAHFTCLIFLIICTVHTYDGNGRAQSRFLIFDMPHKEKSNYLFSSLNAKEKRNQTSLNTANFE